MTSLPDFKRLLATIETHNAECQQIAQAAADLASERERLIGKLMDLGLTRKASEAFVSRLKVKLADASETEPAEIEPGPVDGAATASDPTSVLPPQGQAAEPIPAVDEPRLVPRPEPYDPLDIPDFLHREPDPNSPTSIAIAAARKELNHA